MSVSECVCLCKRERERERWYSNVQITDCVKVVLTVFILCYTPPPSAGWRAREDPNPEEKAGSESEIDLPSEPYQIPD